VRIRQVISPIRGLPNPIRPVVPLISHSCSYPPYHAHLHPPSLSISISNDPCFHVKHSGVPDGTLYPLTENYTLPVAQATGRVAYVPPLLRGDIYASSERHLCDTLPRGCSYAEAPYTTPGDVYAFFQLSATFYHSASCCVSDAALSPYMFSFEMLSLITIQSSLQIHRLPLHLLRHYRIFQV